jgi:hypothetical protein
MTMTMTKTMTLTHALMIAMLCPALMAAPAVAGPSVSLQGRLAKARSPELRWPDWTDYRSHVSEFYKRLGRLAWLQGGVPTPQARAVVAELAKKLKIKLKS